MKNIISTLIQQELNRQQSELELIASENYVSPKVLHAYANVFTNKYSEGYPWKRYYGWQEWVDRMELLTQYRALAVFDLISQYSLEEEERFVDWNISIKELIDFVEKSSPTWWVNVQPLSWSPANLAVYLWLLQPWDTILWMDLNAGGHLSHGFKLNASGIFYNTVFYGVEIQTHLIDREQVEQIALEYKPKIIVAWYSAYPRRLDWSKFARIADKVEQVYWYRPYLMADIAHIAGLIAWGGMESPFEQFDIVTTTTHKTLRWPRWALIYFRRKLEKNINKWVFPGVQWWPHEHIVLAKAVAFGEILDNNKIERKKYVAQVLKNAKVLADSLSSKWWKLITGGTDNHLILVDVAWSFPDLKLDGKIAERILEKIGISVNKNSIPFDINPPLRPSGIRLWTPALTTRWFGVEEFKQVSNIIDKALRNWQDENILTELRKQVNYLAHKFPLPY